MTPVDATTGDEPRTAGIYELMVNGILGPVVQSCFPDFSTLAVNSHSVLTGRCPGPEELRRLLDFLNTRGFPATVIHLAVHTDSTASGKPIVY